MSDYKRNQQGRFRNADQEWNQQLNRRRGEDVYGEDQEYYGDNYRNPNNPPFPIPYAGDSGRQQRTSGFRYGNREDEDFGNYGRGGYYGNTYDQESYNQERNEQRFGRPDSYQNLGDRRWDDGRGGWWENERSERPGYRSNEERRYEQSGMHRGKGPHGYQRSDERIREDINDRLLDDPFIDASDIEVTVNKCEVTLTGTVEDRNAKRRAEDIGESVSGVKNFENRLRVKDSTTIDSESGGQNQEKSTIGTQRSNVREAAK